jgi:hypothetical protein
MALPGRARGALRGVRASLSPRVGTHGHGRCMSAHTTSSTSSSSVRQRLACRSPCARRTGCPSSSPTGCPFGLCSSASSSVTVVQSAWRACTTPAFGSCDCSGWRCAPLLLKSRGSPHQAERGCSARCARCARCSRAHSVHEGRWGVAGGKAAPGVRSSKWGGGVVEAGGVRRGARRTSLLTRVGGSSRSAEDSYVAGSR